MATDRTIFIDTNGWIALLNSSDSLHVAARSLWARLLRESHTFLLTDWIAAETGNGLARTSARSRFPAAVEAVRSSSKVEWATISSELFQRALRLYSERDDKSWGLVDCASFVVMEECGVREAFTNDRHFEQAGFRVLLPLP